MSDTEGGTGVNGPSNGDGASQNEHYSVPAPNHIQKIFRNLPARSKDFPDEYIQWLKKVEAKVGSERSADLQRVFKPMILQVAKELPKNATMEKMFQRLF